MRNENLLQNKTKLREKEIGSIIALVSFHDHMWCLKAKERKREVTWMTNKNKIFVWRSARGGNDRVVGESERISAKSKVKMRHSQRHENESRAASLTISRSRQAARDRENSSTIRLRAEKMWDFFPLLMLMLWNVIYSWYRLCVRANWCWDHENFTWWSLYAKIFRRRIDFAVESEFNYLSFPAPTTAVVSRNYVINFNNFPSIA